MKPKRPLNQLGARERQIMEILFRLGRATATEVQEELGEPLSNSSVRGMLRHLESKGYVGYNQEGPRYVYFPVDRPEDVSKSALRDLVNTFFQSSPSSAMAALLDISGDRLSDEDYKRLRKMLKQAYEGGNDK
jgi:BlaI family transcriptional regulator, penicillinase repressor